MMYTDIYSTHSVHELGLLKDALHRADIPYKILNEVALHVGNVELVGMEGARLQVEANRKIEAIQLLEELGFNVSVNENTSFSLINSFERWTNQIAILRSIPLQFRLLLVFFVMAATLFLLIVLIMMQ